CQPYGVSVFAIQPGTVRTAMAEEALTSEAGRRWLPWFRESFEQGRDVPPEVAARLVLFLAAGQGDTLLRSFPRRVRGLCGSGGPDGPDPQGGVAGAAAPRDRGVRGPDERGDAIDRGGSRFFGVPSSSSRAGVSLDWRDVWKALCSAGKASQRIR